MLQQGATKFGTEAINWRLCCPVVAIVSQISDSGRKLPHPVAGHCDLGRMLVATFCGISLPVTQLCRTDRLVRKDPAPDNGGICYRFQ